MFKRRFQPKETVETITAGYCLRRRRDEVQLSLKEIGQRLGIKEEYLLDLENGNYRDLPPQVYVRGFIKSYAGLLGIDSGQLIKIYNREMSFLNEEEAEGQKDESAGVGRFSLKEYLVITPKILTLAMSLLVVGALGYYFYHQVNSFNSKPYLYVDSPASDEVVKEKDLTVKGMTEKDVILKINGQEVNVGGDGSFSQKIALSSGRNLLLIEARNRFNKIEQREMNIIYEAPVEEKTITELPPSGTDTAAGANADTGKADQIATPLDADTATGTDKTNTKKSAAPAKSTTPTQTVAPPVGSAAGTPTAADQQTPAAGTTPAPSSGTTDPALPLDEPEGTTVN
jgi:cytoskeletal protein RodZ